MALLIRLLVSLAMLLPLAAEPATARADDTMQLREQEIKAGLLYNFLKYIEWPATSVTTAMPSIVVCIFGADPFNGYLQPMAGRTVNQRPITIRNIHDVQDSGGCQLLFVNADERSRWPQLSKFLDGKGVLTVSDFTNFVGAGGMIEFGRKDDHISVQLNMDSIAAARLHVGERLLKLVSVVHTGSP